MDSEPDIISIGPGGYVFTKDMDDKAGLASVIGSASSLALSLFICLAAAWIYAVPTARHHLDRVSFRLLLWSMGVEVVYNVAYLYMFAGDPVRPTENAASCGTAVYFLLATMSTANWLCTFIGVNLMLAITFGINPVRARLERWYVFASFAIGFGISLVPAALGHFGPDRVYEACYFTELDDTARMRDYVVDLYLWQILSCVVAAGSVLAVLTTLFRQSRATERALFRANDLNMTSQELRAITTSTHLSEITSSSMSYPSKQSWLHRLFRRSSSSEGRNMHRLEDKFITIALKISLYPLALIAINVFITVEDLMYTVRGGIRNEGDFILYSIYYFLYGARGLAFALLGLFVDPCLRKGLPAAWKATFHRTALRPILPTSTGHPEKTDNLDPESITDFLSSTPPVSGDTTLCSPTTGFGSLGKKVAWGRNKRGHEGDIEKGVFGTSTGVIEEEEKGGVGAGVAQEELRVIPVSSTLGGTEAMRGLAVLIGSTISSSIVPTPALRIQVPPADTSFNPIAPSCPIPASPPPRSSQTWIEPLATAVLTRTDSPLGPRRSSDPALGESYRRRRELRLAAEKLYADAQAQL